jgi:hypothetical protein
MVNVLTGYPVRALELISFLLPKKSEAAGTGQKFKLLLLVQRNER